MRDSVDFMNNKTIEPMIFDDNDAITANANSEIEIKTGDVGNRAFRNTQENSAESSKIKGKSVEVLNKAESVNSEKVDDASKKEIEKRNGHLYECVGRKENPGGGYIYEFHFRDMYNPLKSKITEGSDVTDVTSKIFPAIEFPFSEACKTIEENIGLLAPLGFAYDKNNDKLSFPDREALIVKWKKLQEDNETLPELRACSSEGIAGDREFLMKLKEHELLISDGVEFLHDMMAHVMRHLKIISELSPGKEGPKEYENYKKLKLEIIETYFQKYEVAKEKGQLTPKHEVIWEHWMGILIDNLTAVPTMEAFKGGHGVCMELFSNSSIKTFDSFNWDMWEKHLDNRELTHPDTGDKITITDLEDFKKHLKEIYNLIASQK